MSLKDKIMNLGIKHPKLVTFGIVLTITFVIVTTIGIADFQHVVFAKIEDQSTLIIP
jgi:hypothetical protein